MSGGSGTRLWPVSTAAKPKQFHAMATDLTMIQETARRLRPEPGDACMFLPPLVICSERHGVLAQRQLAKIGVESSAIILEPVGRNTAAVAQVASEAALEIDPEAIVLLVPADHVIGDSRAFKGAVALAATAAETHIVTLGIQPTGPETGYGYIQRGAALSDAVFEVAAFHEKPVLETAQAYIEDGGYLWNAGMFVFAPSLMIEELKRHRHDIADLARRSFAAADRQGIFIMLDGKHFEACPSDSIDYAVMQSTQRAAVTPCDIGWADVGSWSELWRLGPHDTAGNRLVGPVVADGLSNSLVMSRGPVVAIHDLQDLIVVADSDHVMILPMSKAQNVKSLVAAVGSISTNRIEVNDA